MLHADRLYSAMTPGKLEVIERERLEALERYQIRDTAKKRGGLWNRNKTADKGVSPSLNRRRVAAESPEPVRVSANGELLSVLDVIRVVTGRRHPKKIWERVCKAHPEVREGCVALRNRRGRASWYAAPEEILYLLSRLPGRRAATFFATFLRIALRQLATKIMVTPSGVTIKCGTKKSGDLSGDKRPPDEFDEKDEKAQPN